MELSSFFFDTYAFFELFKGNPAYKAYAREQAILTTKMNLFELHYHFLGSRGKAIADEIYDYYAQFAVEIDDAAIKLASSFRTLHKKRNLSYIDCLGYSIAKMRKIPFLTGDKQFRDLENVEFVK